MTYNYILKMLKIGESIIKNDSFFQKIGSRGSKVSRSGINAILLREHFQQEIGLQVGLKNSKIGFILRHQSTKLFQTPRRTSPNTPSFNPAEAQSHVEGEKKFRLQRYPSERLPNIRRVSQVNQEPLGMRKMKSEQDRNSSNEEAKHRGWKYPPRLSEKALRFFAITEADARGLLRSSRI